MSPRRAYKAAANSVTDIDEDLGWKTIEKHLTANLDKIDPYLPKIIPAPAAKGKKKAPSSAETPQAKQAVKDAMQKLRDAYKWAQRNRKFLPLSQENIALDDIQLDPLATAAIAAKYAKADMTILLAAIVHDAVDLRDTYSGDKLAEIKARFGGDVHDLVVDTLHFGAHNLPDFPHDWSEDQKMAYGQKTHSPVSLAECMGKPGPIIIRSSRHAGLERKYYKDPRGFSPQAKEKLLVNGDYVFPPLLELAGGAVLGGFLEDYCFRIKDPNAFSKTREIIAFGMRSDKDRDLVCETIAAFVEQKFAWRLKEHFDIEYREKSAARAYKKASRRNLKIEDLADLYGTRITLKRHAMRDWFETHNIDISTRQIPPEFEEARREAAGALIKRVHFAITAFCGRGQKQDPEIRKFFTELAARESKDKDSARYFDPAYAAFMDKAYEDVLDAAFDDRVGCPKGNGAYYMKDAVLIELPPLKENGPNRYVRHENQVFDEDGLELFNFGTGAHVFYASEPKPQTMPDGTFVKQSNPANDNGMSKKWLAARAEIMATKAYTGPRPVFVFTDDKLHVIDVSEDPTVGGFIKATGLACKEVRIIRALEAMPPDATFGPGTALKNGDVIAPIAPAP